MESLSKRFTIRLDTGLHQMLRIKALETSRSMSEIINEAVKESLTNDADDIDTFKEKANEPLISHEQMIKRLKKDSRI